MSSTLPRTHALCKKTMENLLTTSKPKDISDVFNCAINTLIEDGISVIISFNPPKCKFIKNHRTLIGDDVDILQRLINTPPKRGNFWLAMFSSKKSPAQVEQIMDAWICVFVCARSCMKSPHKYDDEDEDERAVNEIIQNKERYGLPANVFHACTGL